MPYIPLDIWRIIFQKRTTNWQLSRCVQTFYNAWRYSYAVSSNYMILFKQLQKVCSTNDIILAESYVGVRTEWVHCTVDWIHMLRTPNAKDIVREILRECKEGEWGPQTSLLPNLKCILLWMYCS